MMQNNGNDEILDAEQSASEQKTDTQQAKSGAETDEALTPKADAEKAESLAEGGDGSEQSENGAFSQKAESESDSERSEKEADAEQSAAQRAEALERELADERLLRKKTESKLLCISMLSKHGLPLSLADALVSENPEETVKRVEDVSKTVKEAVADGIALQLATVSPPSEGKSELTEGQFKRLSLSERQQLYRTDKELYRQLTNKN